MGSKLPVQRIAKDLDRPSEPAGRRRVHDKGPDRRIEILRPDDLDLAAQTAARKRHRLYGAHVLIILAQALSVAAAIVGSQACALVLLGLGAVLLDVGVTIDQTIGRRAINLLQPEASFAVLAPVTDAITEH